MSPDTRRLGIRIHLIPEDSVDTILSVVEDTACSAEMESLRVTAGRGPVWGPSGIGPHAPDERHYLPSIDPYHRALTIFGQRLAAPETTSARWRPSD